MAKQLPSSAWCGAPRIGRFGNPRSKTLSRRRPRSSSRCSLTTRRRLPMKVAVPERRQSDNERQPALARARSPAFQPLFLGDWTRALFMHYEVDREALQTEIPLEL